jgi:hypothetical protein
MASPTAGATADRASASAVPAAVPTAVPRHVFPSPSEHPPAVYRSAAAREDGGVVGYVRGQHRPDGRHDDPEQVHVRGVVSPSLNRCGF